MLRRLRNASVGVALIVAGLLPGCGASYEDATAEARPPVDVGQRVTIQFRRDALGGAVNLPVSPTTDSFNGAMVSMAGKVIEVRPQWIHLEAATGSFTNGKADHRRYWIPLDVVLLIESE